MSLDQLWEAYREHGYRDDQPVGDDPLDLFYAALLAFGHQDLARAADLARRAALGAPDERVFTEAAVYLGRVTGKGKYNVYISGEAFAAFISGGGNVPLYEATSAALSAAYGEHEQLDVLDIGVGNGHALLPALTPNIGRLGVVEPSPALLAELCERLKVSDRPIEAFAGTTQEFASQDSGGWTIIQATYSLHSIPPEERPVLLRRLRDLGQRLLIVEFDVPEFAAMYDPLRICDILGRYQRGLAEYNVYVQSRDTGESSNVSAEQLIFYTLYDPFAPTLTINTPLPQWTNLTQLTPGWAASDPPNGGVNSQVKDYMVEQQLNGGTWMTLVASTQANTYLVTSLTNNTMYTFRITARDWAGNQTQQTLTTTIDRDPPSSSLNAPIGQIAKTWTILRWTSSYDHAPIIRFSIDRRINTSWQPFYTAVGVGDSLVFEGTANTVYDLRIRAFDAAGNEQSSVANPQISFTTGSDPTGLFKQYLPITLADSAATTMMIPSNMSSSSSTSVYPLPQP